MKRRAPSFLVQMLGLFWLLIAFAPVLSGQANVQGNWKTLQTMMPINPVHVALLSNGQVLVVAGSGNCPPSQAGCPSGPPYSSTNGSGALIVDPIADTIINKFPLSWDMFCNGMVALEDGRPLIDGGTIQYDPFYGQKQIALFDPASNAFVNIQSMAHGRWYPTVLTLGDGRVMAFSGLNETGSTNTAVEFFTIGSGWSTQYLASWTPDLYPRLHLLPNGTVFYSGAQTTSKLFNPADTTWNTNFANTNYSGTRTYGTSVLLPLTPDNNYDPKVIIMGGGSPSTATTEIIDLGSPTPAWQDGPNMSQPRIEMNAVILPNGRVLAMGGSLNDEDTSTASLNADLYDPTTNTFSSASANVYPRLYHSVALLLPDATVWLAGGNPSRGTYEQPMEIYQPAYLFNPDGSAAYRPSISGAPGLITYGNPFTITTGDAATISSIVLVRNGTVTHAFGMDQREVGLSFTAGTGVLNVNAPANGNLAPPGYYMLFILNSSGVPSLASMVQVTSGAPDFSVSATPSSRTVVPGTGTSYAMNVIPSNGFNGNVTFSVSGLPSGATASFSAASITPSDSLASTLSIGTSSSTPAGSYLLTVTTTSGNLKHTTQLTLMVADFAFSVTPSSASVKRGSRVSYTIGVSALGPFSSTVTFSVAGLPKRVSGSFNPTSVTGSGNSTLTISTNRNSSAGTYPLTITGTGGGITHSAGVSLVIK
jgi:hypothetical protein